MRRHVSKNLRAAVAIRADYRCEYCRMPEFAALIKFHVEHIISIKHGGKSTLDNLAYACPICNSNKGTDVGTVLEKEETFVRFFNPRKHSWSDHFYLKKGRIQSKSPIGLATIKILDFNKPERILERRELIAAGAY
ncbi:MAG: HNH endonuclease [Lewinellaceae bacterium]|nr:HNH endonuclease [Saprospiraceae bacterium]MCB9334178.1 HNH endonuclease [Lewinellaceae bacterium]